MNTNKHDVFVSFSFKDQTEAEWIINRLLNVYNISCWICTRDIRAGTGYKTAIMEAITAAGAVLLIQSENSITSEEVPKEIANALNLKNMMRQSVRTVLPQGLLRLCTALMQSSI